MSGATEIYICKPGQEIKEGKLEYSSTVTSRTDAMADSTRRCNVDPSIGMIVYYAVSEDGSFKTLFSYENPKARKVTKRRVPKGAVTRLPGSARKKQPQKASLFDRVRAVFEK